MSTPILMCQWCKELGEGVPKSGDGCDYPLTVVTFYRILDNKLDDDDERSESIVLCDKHLKTIRFTSTSFYCRTGKE